MEDAVLKTDGVKPPRPEEVASLYAAAATRLVVTLKRTFTTSYGTHQMTGEVITVGYVQPNEAASLEASIASLIDDDLDGDIASKWSAMRADRAIYDPDVLLAWLLTEGVTGRH